MRRVGIAGSGDRCDKDQGISNVNRSVSNTGRKPQSRCRLQDSSAAHAGITGHLDALFSSAKTVFTGNGQ